MSPWCHGCAPSGSAASAGVTARVALSVEVCSVPFWLTFCQVTVAPRGTMSDAGTNLFASIMYTVKTRGFELVLLPAEGAGVGAVCAAAIELQDVASAVSPSPRVSQVTTR